MTTTPQRQFLRSAKLTVVAGTEALDLSELKFRFSIKQQDVESPNNAVIRVYNLSGETAKRITGKVNGVEFTKVIVQAGYERGVVGEVFNGTIKQFYLGKENNVDSYLDIMAADGDIGYTFGMCNRSFLAGSRPSERLAYLSAQIGAPLDSFPVDFNGNPPLPRGKVQFGLARDGIRTESDTMGATWSIQNGKLQVTNLKGYLPGEAVVINSQSGMIGIPELTDEGVRVRMLLNPRLVVGTLVKINSADINRLSNTDVGSPIFNSRARILQTARISADGFYRLYVAEHTGDTRGTEWYSDLIALAVDISSKTVVANQ